VRLQTISRAPLPPLVTNIDSTGEVTYLFKISKAQKHLLTFSAEVEVDDQEGSQTNLCKYFNAIVSIDTLHNLGSRMQTTCGKDRQLLFDHLPHSVTTDTLINKSKYCVQMPALNKSLTHDQTTKAEIQINLATLPYHIESEVLYDFPFLQVGLSVQQAEHADPGEEESGQF
jgi:hypothetical protein